jgi:hypothetical protein
MLKSSGSPSHDLIEELEWEQEMDARTREKYCYLE